MTPVGKHFGLLLAVSLALSPSLRAEESAPAAHLAADEWDEESFSLEEETASAGDEGEGADGFPDDGDDAEDDGDKEIVVTGSRIRRGSSEIPGAEQLGRDRIEEAGADTLADILERVAGVQVRESLGTGSEVMLDGLDGKYVLVLIDGQPVNGFVNDRVDLDRLGINVEDVERIDVVRGPMSAVYGSQALGGVVHIITRRPRSTPRFYLQLGSRLSPGGLSREAVTVSGSGGVGPLAMRLSLSGLHDSAIDRGGMGPDGEALFIPDRAHDLPHRRLGDARLALSLYALPSLTVRSSLWFGVAQLESRESGLLPSRDATDTTQVDATVGIEWEPVRDHELIATARVSRFTHRFFRLPDGDEKDPPPFCVEGEPGLRFFDPACPRPARVSSDALQDLGRLELIHRATWLRGIPFVESLDTATGAVLELQHGQRLDREGADTLGGKGQRTLAAAYGEARYRPFSRLTLAPGLRLDGVFLENDLSQPVVGLGPKLSARVDLPFGLFLQAAYGQGFRVPGFIEQHLRFDHSELGYIIQGNPDLEPERSTGVRLEAGLKAGKLTLRGEIFANAFEDLITERLVGANDVGTAIYTYDNRDRAWTAGAHLRAELASLYGFSFEGGVEWLPVAHDTTACESWFICSEEEGAVLLAQRSPYSAHVSARYFVEASRTTLFSQLQLQGPRSITDTQTAPMSTLLSFGLRQALPADLALTVSLDNVLDQYHPVYGPKPGLAVRAALRGAWSAH